MNQKKTNTQTQTFWRLNRYFKPHVKRWDEEYVLFDAASGDTHVIDSLSGFVIERLKIDAASVDLLSAELIATEHYSMEEKKALLTDVLHELSVLQFVEEVVA